MFPVVGVFGAIAAALGLYTMYWYENLSKEEKDRADQLAKQYAMSLYNTGLDKLTSDQLARVNTLVKGHFTK